MKSCVDRLLRKMLYMQISCGYNFLTIQIKEVAEMIFFKESHGDCVIDQVLKPGVPH